MSSAHWLNWVRVPSGTTPPSSVDRAVNPARITSFTLINADTDQPIGTIEDGAVLNLAKLPKNLNIAANVSGGKNGQSVNFIFDGRSRTENGVPFALGSDTNGDFWGWTTTVGKHSLQATPWTGRGATGSPGTSKTIHVTVVRNATQPAIGSANTKKNTGGKANPGSSNPTTTGGGSSNNTNPSTGDEKTDAGGIPKSTGGSTKDSGDNTDNSGDNTDNSGGDTSHSTGNTDDTTTDPAPPPVVKNDQGGPVAIIDAIATTAPAGTAIHVNALKSTLKAGDVLNARFDWDFGDSGSKYNQLTGFNAAHLYEEPGTYTITLAVTNSAGKVGAVQSKVRITADDRQVIYVSPNGNDGNSGTSQSSAVKSFARASQLVGDNTEILFQRGSTYTTPDTMSLGYENVVLGAYGSGRAPVLKFTGKSNQSTILSTYGGKNVTIRDLTFDSAIGSISDHEINDCIHVGGENISVLSCTVVNASYFINTNGHPDGFLAQDNTTTSAGSLRGYFAWVQGADQVYLGNTCHDSTWQHCLRNGGTDRLLIAYNDFSNAPNPGGVFKGTLTLHQGNYIYVTQNKLTHGSVGVGPLNAGSGLDNIGARINYIVLENNQITDSPINVTHGANHVAIRDNLLVRDNGPAIDVSGWSDQYKRGTTDVRIEDNTAVTTGTSGKFLLLENDASDITLSHNLYVSPHLAVEAGNGALEIMTGNLNSFREISDNVWPAPTDGYNAGEGFLYMSANGVNDHAGYKDAGEWNAYSKVDHDQFKDVILPGGSYQISLGGVIAGAELKMAA